ncbi:hypothetical protein K458DRAFT_415825 [Lentithecium fluviatile CBS 122367]|uniref:Uncharacterized protein n=1 Tax=Lentithecium fluviatile CBS 122367 TaxID=1168545 RepID=A0A6G1J7D2_9PLEO|nr:hypothetical protein K458DRAFT_415825 [Lentithecium fluviatile CBS 122367]
MSAESLPISSERFSKALQDLSLSSLYLKVAELRNSIAHLDKSNAELEEFVRVEQDKDCYEALVENKEVIARMEERIALIKKEVMEVRGLPWQPEDGAKMVEPGERPIANAGAAEQNGTTTATANTRTNGVTSEQRDGNAGDEAEEGVFL